jgi:hypothetical protein
MNPTTSSGVRVQTYLRDYVWGREGCPTAPLTQSEANRILAEWEIVWATADCVVVVNPEGLGSQVYIKAATPDDRPAFDVVDDRSRWARQLDLPAAAWAVLAFGVVLLVLAVLLV